MKKILIPFVLILVLVAFLGYKKTNSQVAVAPIAEKTATPVTMQTASDSSTLKENLVFPGIVLGKDEAKITAKSAGTITSLNFDLGKAVTTGQLLVKIDDTGNNLETGKNDLQSANVQQLEQAKTQAKRSSTLANKNYEKSSSVANRIERDIAKSKLEAAEINLASSLDSHLITTPISGKIVTKNVSLGDSVSQGQILATISKSDQLKIQFFVDSDQYPNFSVGLPLTLVDNNQNTVDAKVSNISPTADAATKKFLIEALPIKKGTLLSGTIVDVTLSTTKYPKNSTSILLPLSAITIGQNENYLFIVENGKAKKINITIDSITGETAEINLDLPKETQIIISGNKSLQDGDAVEVRN
jgi:RND family efflux transporter MFP subunit